MTLNYINTTRPEADELANQEQYDQETHDTGVIYRAWNMTADKSYIGKAFSYVKNGKQQIRKHGAKDRFYKHWMAAHNNVVSDCPIFYDALVNSKIDDWFIFTLKVCSKKHLKEWETKLTKEYKTCDPKFGYNYFVGDNKPDNEEYSTKYSNAKAASNANRAKGGALRRQDHSKNLPPNIHYRISRKSDGTLRSEGYFVQIKINGVLYNKAFLSLSETMEVKLDKAIKQLALFKQIAEKKKNGEQIDEE